MSLAESIVGVLKAASAVTAIVGAGSAARIEPDEPDESTARPMIFYDLDKLEEVDITGSAGDGFAVLTITCRADERSDSVALASAVRGVLGGYAGVFDSWLEDEQWSSVPFDDASGRAYRDVVQTYQVCYRGE